VKLVAITSKIPKIKPPKLRNKPPEARQEEKKVEQKEKPEEKLTGQVVDIPPSPDDTPPEDAKYLSEYNTRTERETRSRHQARLYENAMNERTTAKRAKLADPKPSERQATALEVGPETKRKPTEKKQGSQATVFELPSVKPREQLALKLDPEFGRLKNQAQRQSLKGNSKRLKLAIGKDDKLSEQGTAPKRAPRIAELVPNVGVLARLSGDPSNDHLEDLEEGEGTFLNSREFKYASFFNRMKRGVSQHWDPLTEYRRRDPTGNIYGYRSRVTVLSVTLAPDGSLKNVEVKESSGIDFLDREAVSAFKRAQPFPNPPRGLIQEGIIEFPFGFHVDFSRRSGLRLPF
jgi:TonB family protein